MWAFDQYERICNHFILEIANVQRTIESQWMQQVAMLRQSLCELRNIPFFYHEEIAYYHEMLTYSAANTYLKFHVDRIISITDYFGDPDYLEQFIKLTEVSFMMLKASYHKSSQIPLCIRYSAGYDPGYAPEPLGTEIGFSNNPSPFILTGSPLL